MSVNDTINFHRLLALDHEREWRKKNKQRLGTYKKELYQKRRNTAIELLGGKCEYCSENIDLQFHHKYYVEDSKKQAHIFKEVEKYPNRFELVCFECHNIITFVSKNKHKARIVIDRILNNENRELCKEV